MFIKVRFAVAGFEFETAKLRFPGSRGTIQTDAEAGAPR